MFIVSAYIFLVLVSLALLFPSLAILLFLMFIVSVYIFLVLSV